MFSGLMTRAAPPRSRTPPDLRVRAAAADVTVHGADDLVVRRVRHRLEQCGGGHDHAGGAVAALHRGLFDERLLERAGGGCCA